MFVSWSRRRAVSFWPRSGVLRRGCATAGDGATQPARHAASFRDGFDSRAHIFTARSKDNILLVGGLVAIWIIFPFNFGNFIIPIDELHHFSEGWPNHQPDWCMYVHRHWTSLDIIGLCQTCQTWVSNSIQWNVLLASWKWWNLQDPLYFVKPAFLFCMFRSSMSFPPESIHWYQTFPELVEGKLCSIHQNMILSNPVCIYIYIFIIIYIYIHIHTYIYIYL